MMLLLDSYGEEPQIMRDAERLAEHFSMKEFTKVVENVVGIYAA